MNAQEIIDERKTKCSTLEAAIPTIEQWQSPDDILEQMILRDEERAENVKLINKFKERIQEMEKHTRTLREINMDLSNQNKRLDRAKWSLLASRKINRA